MSGLRSVKGNNARVLIFAILIFIGVAYMIMGLYMPFLGDDLGFYYSYQSQDDCFYALPRSMYRHWMWNNARFADFITPIGVYIMPASIRVFTYGLFVALFYYLILEHSIKSINQWFWAIIIIALVAFTFRWDAIWMEYCSTYNYVWSSVFVLIAVALIFWKGGESKAWYWWAAVPFCFIASAMHEAAGAPMAAGMIISLFVRKDFGKQNAVGKCMILAFIFGGIFTLTSPASYTRVGSMLQPESPIEMLLFSSGYVLLLIIAVVALSVFNRPILKLLIKSEWLVFVVAAICSTGFMLLGQYGGRTGWFAQTFALIALFQIVSRLKIKIPLKVEMPISLLLAACVIFHYSAVAYWQIKVGTEANKAIEMLKESSNGIIFMDYHNEPDLPWYLLSKTHGVPDADDSYYIYRVGLHHGNGNKLIILPLAAKHLDWENYSGISYYGDIILSDRMLPDRYEDVIVDIFPRVMTKIGGREYIEQSFTVGDKCFYLYSPVDRDRGEK